MDKRSYVYIMGNNKPVLYVGITSNLQKRVWEHKNNLIDGFTKKYEIHKLFYYEEYSDIKIAIAREKQIKNWHRDWKLNLIQTINPKFDDLYDIVIK